MLAQVEPGRGRPRKDRGYLAELPDTLNPDKTQRPVFETGTKKETEKMHTPQEVIAMSGDEKWAELEAIMARRYGYPDKRGGPTQLAADIGRHYNTYYKWRDNKDSIDPLAIIALERMTVDDEEKEALQRRLLSEIADDLEAVASKLSDLSRALRS